MLGTVGALVVAVIAITAWSAVAHGHPAYAVLLALTATGSLAVVVLALRGRRGGSRPRLVLGIVAVLESDVAATVTESATEIVLMPAGAASATGVLFQPGALVDARGYVALLRPLAEAGYPVVIPKQPLGIAFLAVGALDDVRERFPAVDGWVVGGHSLGGTVAALEADSADEETRSPAVGLLLYASYPAGDIRDSLTVPVLSISGSADGLATPEQIDASRDDLPADAEFVEIAGAAHAQFGAYGPRSGDGEPTIDDDAARERITAATLRFVTDVAG